MQPHVLMASLSQHRFLIYVSLAVQPVSLVLELHKTVQLRAVLSTITISTIHA